MATSQLKPWQAQHFRSKQPHISTCGKYCKQTWPPHNLNPDNCGTWQTNTATSQLNLDSLNAGRRSNSEANMATTQRKPGRGSFWQANMATSQLSRGKYLTNKRGHLTASAAAGFKLWGGHVSFEILRLPRFVHRNLPCSATTGGTTRSPSVILARCRAQILRLPENRH